VAAPARPRRERTGHAHRAKRPVHLTTYACSVVKFPSVGAVPAYRFEVSRPLQECPCAGERHVGLAVRGKARAQLPGPLEHHAVAVGIERQKAVLGAITLDGVGEAHVLDPRPVHEPAIAAARWCPLSG
jgi:hypothetical protein